jgi:predicted regulator of Ras-like GTPase activity (Roadblock/LC7/MglB family)
MADETLLAGLRVMARVEARALAADLAGIRAVVVASADGFDLASALCDEADARRVAALARSIAAIGVVVSAETGLGRSSGITVTTEAGFIYVQQVRRADALLVINVVAGPDAVLAQVVLRSARAAQRLAQA